MAASAAELTTQALSLIEMNKELVSKVEKLEEEVAARAEGVRAEGDGARGLVDVKKLFPEPFAKEEEFKDWK